MIKKRINSIDVMRIIAAFAVVTVHTKFFGSRYLNSTLINAVPLFFMISGFFYCVSQEKKLKRIKSMFFITIMSNLLYMVVGLVMSYLQGNLSEFVSEKFSLESLINFVFFNDSPFAVHLWYLSALLYCMVIDYFISKFNISKKVILIAIITIIMVDFIIGKYSILIWGGELPGVWIRNFIFSGLPYFYAGKLFRTVDIDKFKVSNVWLIILMVFFTLTTLAEKFTMNYYQVAAQRENYISSTLFTFVLFIFLLKNPAENPSKFVALLADLGRKYSLYIYVDHMLFRHMFALAKDVLGETFENIFFIFGPIFMIACSFAVAVAYYKAKQLIMKKIQQRRVLKEG